MDRLIAGFHLDREDDWVAELSCGHQQHVRHRPPFQQRPWVLTANERAARVGTPVSCPLCDRGELPVGLRLVRSSPQWTERSVPAALLRSHRLAPGTWGLLNLLQGRLEFSMASEPAWTTQLVGPDTSQGIPPEVDHQVTPLAPVRFFIDFFTVDRTGGHDREAGNPSPSGDRGRRAGLAG